MSRISLVVVFVVAAASGCVFDDNGPSFGGDDGDEGADPGDQVGPSDNVAPIYPCGGDSDEANDPLPGGELICFDNAETTDTPAATIEHGFEIYDGVEAVHVRLTFDPSFVDNTYGAGSIGWNETKRGVHTFEDLVKSDHAEILLIDEGGETLFDLKIDYLMEDPDAPCGYSSGGVSGDNGEVVLGDIDAVLGWSTSLDRNLNERGYCDYTTDSPLTDDVCTPNPDAPDWDFRVVYEIWVRADAFVPAGFGTASIDYVHASPAKGPDNTVVVTPGDCPCNDPDGCDNHPSDPPPPDDCTDDTDCPTGEFCNESGACAPYIE